MDNDLASLLGAALVMIVLVLFLGLAYFLGHAYGYEKGQVDAINGNIKYELVEQEDGTTDWEYKEGD